MNIVGCTSDNKGGVLVLTISFADEGGVLAAPFANEGGVLATSIADEGGVLAMATSWADAFVDAVTEEVESVAMSCISLEDAGSVEATTGRLEFP